MSCSRMCAHILGITSMPYMPISQYRGDYVHNTTFHPIPPCGVFLMYAPLDVFVEWYVIVYVRTTAQHTNITIFLTSRIRCVRGIWTSRWRCHITSPTVQYRYSAGTRTEVKYT